MIDLRIQVRETTLTEVKTISNGRNFINVKREEREYLQYWNGKEWVDVPRVDLEGIILPDKQDYKHI